MYLFLLFFFSILFLMGAAICFMSMAKYTTFAETEGEIIDYLKCNPVGDEDQQKNKKEEAVVISYTVGGKIYHLATNVRTGKNAELSTSLKVLYNPYFPGQSQLKEGTPLLGGILMIVSLLSLAILIFFF